MNVASLDLCRELYELSGWVDTWHQWHERNQELGVVYQPNVVGDRFTRFLAPAYDLGYLLRKLPDIRLRMVGTRWCAQNTDYGHDYLADTPQDAAAKLAIELFKQGVLTR